MEENAIKIHHAQGVKFFPVHWSVVYFYMHTSIKNLITTYWEQNLPLKELIVTSSKVLFGNPCSSCASKSPTLKFLFLWSTKCQDLLMIIVGAVTAFQTSESSILCIGSEFIWCETKISVCERSIGSSVLLSRYARLCRTKFNGLIVVFFCIPCRVLNVRYLRVCMLISNPNAVVFWKLKIIWIVPSTNEKKI